MAQTEQETKEQQPTNDKVDQTSADRAAELDETFRQAARDGTLYE
ncbi:Uncharacterised protein [uncultured archaeon]|nr:Uncharacterised protein [uncultured archaeon]